jgi:hypothetical protein
MDEARRARWRRVGLPIVVEKRTGGEGGGEVCAWQGEEGKVGLKEVLRAGIELVRRREKSVSDMDETWMRVKHVREHRGN